VGKLSNRVAALEKIAPSWVAPTEEEQRKRIIRRASQRLSVVELGCLTEVLKIRREHPDISGADLWRLLTPTQRDMESLWRWLLWKESQAPEMEDEEGDQEMRERTEELARRRAMKTPDVEYGRSNIT
jgi:hypothetical protein